MGAFMLRNQPASYVVIVIIDIYISSHHNCAINRDIHIFMGLNDLQVEARWPAKGLPAYF